MVNTTAASALLCKIAGILDNDGTAVYQNRSSSGVLPSTFYDYMGMKAPIDPKANPTLTVLNDTCRFTFPKIADAI